MSDMELILVQDQNRGPEQSSGISLEHVIDRPPSGARERLFYDQIRSNNPSVFSNLLRLNSDDRNFVLGELYNSGNSEVRNFLRLNFPGFRPTGVGQTTDINRIAQLFGRTPQDLQQPGVACQIGSEALAAGNDMIARIVEMRNSIPDITSNPERRLPSLFSGPNPVGVWDIWGMAPSHTVHDSSDGQMRPEPPYWNLLQSVFSGSHTELSRNHNDVLQTELRPIMISRGLNPDAPVTVVNVDAHSDILRRIGSNTSIADWGNEIIRRNPNVTDYYWILPDEFRQDPRIRQFFTPGGEVDVNFANAPSDFTAYVHNTSNEIRWFDSPPENEISQYRAVNIHLRTMNTMNDNLRGQNVVLTTDLDIFANRGFDTVAEAETRWQGNSGFEHYLRMLESRGIRPFFHFLSFSPEYVERNREVWNGLLQFAALSAQASPDGTSSWFTNHLNRVYPRSSNEHDGIALNARGNTGMELILALFQIDAQSQNPNGIINLSTDNPERRLAIQAARRIFNADSDEQALSILRRFAPANQQLNFRATWQAMRDMCRTRF